MNPCYLCMNPFIVLDNIEGTLICTECGSVQESNLTWNDIHYEVDDYLHDDHYTNTYAEKTQQCESIPESCWREAQILFESLPTKYRGRVKQGVYANCLHQICLIHNIPRSLKEISELLHIDIETMNETSKHAKKNEPNQNKLMNTSEMMDQDDEFSKMLPRYLEKIKPYITTHSFTNQKKYNIIKKISQWLHNDNLMEGKTPHTKIVTLIYYYFFDHMKQIEEDHIITITITKKELCSLFDISIVTLNKSYKQLLRDFSNL